MKLEPDQRDARAGAPPDSDGASDGRGPDESNEEGNAEGALRCPTCGTEVPEGRRSCPVCRRGVYRTCFCGWQLPVTESRCPNCGADWSQSARVQHKSRSRARRTRDAVRYAVTGAVVAIVAALVVHVVLGGFAALALDGQAMPREIGERLRLALNGVAELLGRAWAAVASHGPTVALVIGVMALGAAAGVAVYLLQQGRLSGRSSSSRRVRRKRRK